jgi:hypothetical protein
MGFSEKVSRLVAAATVAAGCVALALAVPAAWAGAGDGPRRTLVVDSVRVGTKVGPVAVRIASRPAAKVWISVNGKRVGRDFGFAGHRAREIVLHRGDGIVPGANRLLIRSRRGATTLTARRTVELSPLDLLADAGEDKSATVRSWARVGAALPSRARRAGVTYRWRVVGRPRGSKASLRGSRDVRPVLQAETPGTYVLELEENPQGPGPDSFDQTTVTVAPEDPAIGVPIDTLKDNAIEIGGKRYGAYFGVKRTSYVVLSRTTRQPVLDPEGKEVSGSVANDAGGMASLLSLAKLYGDGQNYMNYLMIISGNYMPEGQVADFGRLAKKLGAALPSEEDFKSVVSHEAQDPREYSIIGIPGAPEGAATIRIPDLDPKSVSSGSIVGYLQKLQAVNLDGVPVYSYVSPENPSFDTSREHTATSNTMTVGPAVFQGSLPAGGSAGFQITIVDPFTVRGVISTTIATNTANDSLTLDRKVQGEAAATLKSILNYPGHQLVFVQTIGKPKAAGPEWEGVVEQLARLGANHVLVNALDGSSEYALVGHVDSNRPAVESSTAYDHGPYGARQYPPARLVGSLARARNYRFEVTVSSTPTTANPGGMVNLGLISLAYQPARAFPILGADADPPPAPGEGAAAESYICQRLGFCQDANSCPDMRSCYWQRFGATDWNGKQSELTEIRYPDDGTKAKLGFVKTTFEAVKAQLFREISALVADKKYLLGLQEPLEKVQAESADSLKRISEKVWDSLQRPEGSTSTAWVLGVIGKTLSIGSFAGPPVSGIAAGMAATFGLVSYLSTETGQPILGTEVKAEAAQLGTTLIERLNLARQASYGLGKLVAGDYGKLMDLSHHAATDWLLPENPEAVATPLRLAAKQWFYEALVPVAYPYLIRANDDAKRVQCRGIGSGWPAEPDSAEMWVTIGYDGNGNPIKGMYFFARGFGRDSSPPDSLGQEMFKPRRDGGLEMEKFTFLTPQVFGNRVAHAVNTGFYCELGNMPKLL